MFTITKATKQNPYNDQAILLLSFGASLLLRTIISLYVKNIIAKIETKSTSFILLNTPYSFTLFNKKSRLITSTAVNIGTKIFDIIIFPPLVQLTFLLKKSIFNLFLKKCK